MRATGRKGVLQKKGGKVPGVERDAKTGDFDPPSAPVPITGFRRTALTPLILLVQSHVGDAQLLGILLMQSHVGDAI